MADHDCLMVLLVVGQISCMVLFVATMGLSIAQIGKLEVMLFLELGCVVLFLTIETVSRILGKIARTDYTRIPSSPTDEIV